MLPTIDDLGGIISITELRRRFPLDIVVIVGSALTVAQLMISSGVSESMGQFFIETLNGWECWRSGGHLFPYLNFD